jgi:outer membrane protein assembly factor BamA
LGGGKSVRAAGGLQGAVRGESASATIRTRLSKLWDVGLGFFYDNNSLLAQQLSTTNGHSVSGTVSFHGQLAQNLGIDVGYMRLHESYASLPTLSVLPNTNRVWLSLSYQFTRPIGR